MTYIARIAEERIRRLASLFPAVAVTGPRQSGKSTLLGNAFPEYRIVTFDSPQERAFFEDDPLGFMKALPDKVILDEVQKVPALFEYLKIAIDTDRTAGRFLLTGSAQFSLVKGISETLAGRCGTVSLLPFQSSESPTTPWPSLEIGGSYPELVTREHEGSAEWYDAYIMSYIERDLRSLLNIEKLRDFRIVLGLLAARTAQELNLSSIARESGISEKTVAAWISVLEASYIVFLVQPYHRNLGKRLVKRPKLYFWDTGLACRLTGIPDHDQLEKGPLAGAMFENFVAAELSKDIAHRGTDTRLYYFRSNAGIEADFVLEDATARSLVFGETKRRISIRPDDFKHIKALAERARAEEPSWKVGAVVVNAGDAIHSPTSGSAIVGVGCPGGFRIESVREAAFSG